MSLSKPSTLFSSLVNSERVKPFLNVLTGMLSLGPQLAPSLSRWTLRHAVGLAFVSWALFKAWTFLSPRVPTRLRNIPTMNALQHVQYLRKSPLQRYEYVKRLFGDAPMYKVYFLGRWKLVLREPDLAKHLLSRVDLHPKFTPSEIFGKDSLSDKLLGEDNIIFQNGEEWRRHRRVANPAFKKNFDVEIFGECTRTMIGEWEKLGPNSTINIYSWMQKITLDILSKAIFQLEFKSLTTKPEQNKLVKLYEETNQILTNPIFFLFPRLGRFMYSYLEKSMNQFDELLGKMIDERRREVLEESPKGRVFNDLISLMIQAEMNGEGDDGPKLTREALKRNAYIFFIAGHDTTSNALSCVLYHLAKYPEFQDRVRSEIIDIVGPIDPSNPYKVPSFDEQKRLSFMTAFIMETLRLYPSASIIPFRRVKHPLTLAGVDLTPDEILEGDIMSVNRSSKAWKDAETFDPSRFYNPNSSSQNDESSPSEGRVPFSWIPFGGGTRQCIGMTMSLIETRVILTILLRVYQFTIPSELKNESIKFETGILLNPGDSIQLRVQRIVTNE